MREETEAERVVVREEARDGALHGRRVDGLANLHETGLVPVARVGDVELQPPALDGGERDGSGDGARLGGRGAPRAGDGGERGDAGVLEDMARRDADVGLRRARHDLDAEDGVPPELEEVVVDAHLRDTEHALPDVTEDRLHGARGRDEGPRRIGPVPVLGRGQGASVDLAVGRERERREQHEGSGDHVLRQLLRERGAQPGDGGHALAHRAAGADEVSHEPEPAAETLGDDDRLAHGRVLAQGDLDLARLDAVAADLDLVVGAAEVLDGARGEVAREVAGAVQARAGGAGERVGHEPFGRQRGPVEVPATDLHAGEVDLAADALGDRLQAVVEQVDASVVHGPTDGDDRARRRALPGGDVDGGLRGPVEVVQRGAGERGEEAIGEGGRQRLAAGEDAADGVAAPEVGLLDEHAEQRGNEVQRRDRLRGDGLDEVLRVAVAPGPGHDETGAEHQRPEQLPHRDVEAERRLLEHPIARVERVGVLHPEEPVEDGAVRDERALGPPRRAGSVDGVGEVLQRERAACGARGRLPDDGRPVRVEEDHLGRVGHRGQRAREVGLGEDDLEPGVLDHEGEAIPRVLGIERQVRAARPEHAVERDHHLEAALHVDADEHVGPDAALAERVGDAVGARVELAVAELLALEDDGDRVGRPRRLVGDQLVDRPILRVGEPGVVPADQVLLALGGAEQWQSAEPRARHRDEPFEQGGEVAEHALDPPRVEAGGVEAEAEQERGAERALQRERVGRALHGAGRGEREAAPALLQRLLDRLVLEHHEALEERRPGRHARERVHVGKRARLVLVQRGLLLEQRGEEGHRGVVRPEPNAHGQRVDEEAHHPVDARYGRRTPRRPWRRRGRRARPRTAPGGAPRRPAPACSWWSRCRRAWAASRAETSSPRRTRRSSWRASRGPGGRASSPTSGVGAAKPSSCRRQKSSERAGSCCPSQPM